MSYPWLLERRRRRCCYDPRHVIRWETSTVCKLPCHGAWCATAHAPPPDTRKYWWYSEQRNDQEYHDHCWDWSAWYHGRWEHERCGSWCSYGKECALKQHGPWCSYDLHTEKRIDHTRIFNDRRASPEQARKTSSLLNHDLTEEVEVVNAIYGAGTLEVMTDNGGKLRLRLELPLGESMVFWLNLTNSYPKDNPSIQQAELCLHQETDRRIQNIFLILFLLLETQKREVISIESLLHQALPIIASLCNYTFDADVAIEVAPDVNPEIWRWTGQTYIDMGIATELKECVICCDDYFVFTMARAPCKHYLCLECLTTGWEVVSTEGEPYNCCDKAIPLEHIKPLIPMSQETEWRYKRLLMEKSVRNPFYCGNAKCKELMGDFSQRYLSRGKFKRYGVGPCRTCLRNTCVRCREEYHPGPCIPQDDAFEKLASAGNIRRCPSCGYVWEKNGGCRHVVCPGCSSHWWWRRNGQLEDYALHRHRLHLLERDEELLDDEGEMYMMQEAPEITGEEAARALDRIEAIRAQQQQDADVAIEAVEEEQNLAGHIDAG